MNRLTISMPEPMNAYVESQINTGRYGNVSEYFRDLVRRDQDNREAAVQELRGLIDEGLASGISNRKIPEIIEAARKEARNKGLSVG